MQAIILAGGKGTRLKPFTATLPKPLVPLGNHPILEVILRQLKNQNFNRVTLAVGHLSHLIQAYFGNGSRFGLSIDYSFEETPLGTAGPLGLIKDTDDHFLVMNSDDLTDFSYGDFFENHKHSGAAVSIAMFNKKHKIDLGVLKVTDGNLLTDYIEKPIYDFNVSMGIYAFSKKTLAYIPLGKKFDFPDLIRLLMQNNEKVLCYPHRGYWLDIGRPDDYEKACEQFENKKIDFWGTE